MTDEEAALLAELRAISNNSSSNDRFVGGEDDAAAEETPKPQHTTKVNSLSTTTTPSTTKSSPTTNATTTTNHVSSNTTTTTATTISPPKRLSTPLASEKEAGKFISDLKVMLHNANGSHAPGMDRRDEDSADGDSTLSSRHSPSSSSFQAEQESAFHPSASHSGAGNGAGGFTSGPKTFKGDNGGMAADDDLLAELKAISAKSSSGDRFAGDENDEENDAAGTSSRPSVPNDPPTSLPKKATPTKKSSLRPPGEVPPWKRKSRNKSIGSKKEVDASDKVPGSQTALPSPTPTPTQAPSATQPEPTPPTGGGFTSGPKTFNGDNGGMAADDDLLAELRAISNKSSVDRFSGGDEDENDGPVANDPVVPVPVAVKKKPTPKKPSPKKSFRDPGEVPPWKKKAQNKTDVLDTTDDGNPATDTIANNKPAMPTSAPTGGGFTSGPKTFKGDNGGMAADDDLLAELRAISNNSSADRFSGGDDDDENDVKADTSPPVSNDSPVVKKKPTPKKSYRASGEVPPWKRKSRTQSNEKPEEDVATTNVKKTDKASTDDNTALPTPVPAPPTDGGGFSSGPKTFSGDRGGMAEDDDLLAELRAISNKSSADRFVGGDDEDDGDIGKERPSVASDPPIVKKKSTPKKPSPKKSFRPPGEVPPWKQKAQSKKSMVDTTDDGVVNDQNDTSGVGSKAAPQTSAPVSPPKGGGGFTSGPKTFNGDRGGMAADDDLLAELRAISNQSSADRFSGGDDEDGGDNAGSSPPVRKDPPVAKKKATPKKSSPKKSVRASGEVPPWKKKGAAKDSPAAPKAGGGGFSSGPKTFNGDRGGMAADDDLLAELKAISAGSSSNRFSEESGEKAETGSTAVPSPKSKVKETIMQPPKQRQSPPKRSFAADTAPTSLPPMTAPAEDEIIITEQTLLSALDSKVWKERKAAYLFLSSNLSGRVESTSEVDVNELLPTLETPLDSLIPKMVKESNAAALDAALSFLVLYADNCVNAGKSEQAFEITKQLCSGSGLSGRPSALKLAKQLVMKLMEVSREGVSSVHSTVEVLLTDGLASKKPKVVLNSITLVLDACHAFGASSLPVHVITKSAQKMLSHANGTVRDTSIQIFAEICRAVGSKDPLEPVLEIMKSAQLSQLDSILEKDSAPSQPTIGFRHDSTSGGSADMAETLKLEAEKSKQEKFASRPAVNIFKLLPDTEYSSKIKEKKWSEKVGALDILLQCGGQKPYKLEQPSPSIEYAPLISELKSLLGHTHFAVSSRSMAVIGMLSEGVGSKLFPYLKPLIPDLLVFAKDKKLTRASQSCLDSMFGNIVSFDHLLEKEDSLPSTLDEKEQKNALVRKSAIEFLKRCVERSETAGPRGGINVDIAERIVQLASGKLNDSDASVRGEATQLLKVMLGHKEKEISDVCQKAIQVLQDTNPRLYKSLQSNSKSETGLGGAPPLSPTKKKQRSALPKKQGTKKPGGAKPAGAKPVGKRPIPKKQTKNSQAQPTNSDVLADCDEGHIPPYEDAMTSLTCLNIPNWNKEEDEGGIVSGLQASNWKFRKEAIDQMEVFTKSQEAIAAGSTYPSNVVVFLRQNTREFKESNFNILKAVMEVLIAICESFCSSTQHLLEVWICRAAVTIAIGKVSDKKLSETSYQLLSSLCEVQSPEIIFALCLKGLETIKSPLPREGFSLWSITFFQDFGVKALGSGLSTFVNWAVNDCASTNIRVKKAAISAIGEIHKQVGPMIKAVVNANTNVESSVKEMIEKELASFPYNPSSSSGDRKRKAPNPKGSKSQSSGGGDSDDFMVPKTDFVASLPDDCMVNLGMKEGKDAWKKRKAALEDIEAACGQYKCLISTTPSCMKSLVDLCRALRLRLSDSQSNLKPLAARNIASLLNAIDAPSQAKLGKFIYAPLINAAMNDNKKPMREAAIDAIKLGTTKMDTEGGEVNPAAMDCFMAALVSELNDGYKAIGLPQVLDFTIERAKFFTRIDSITSVKAASQEAQFASSMVSCLVSSKAEARSKAEQVLRECLQFGTVNPSSIEKAILKLNTAEQRTARNIFPSLDVNVSTTTKPNESTPTRRVSRKSRVEDRKSISRNRKRSESRTRPISSRKGRDSLTSSNKNSDISASSLNNILSDSTSNPLRSLNGVGPSKSQRLSMSRSRDNWPEYPEEPTGSGVLASLKKSWGSHLPTSSISFLFPEKGIQKQEDASSGCELLTHSLSISEKDDGDNSFIEQLDFVNKWLAYAICSRESTVGMQTLISFLLKMFSSLRQKRYQMSDSESAILLPFLLEKAGAAKGRFREMLHDLLSTISSDEIIPMATYGSIICVSVMDRSSVSKARALAARECQHCVEKYGLPAIGKKGIQVTARGISEEHIAENKTAFLDLIEEIVYKMNGDIQRYIKACGNANLSNRARDTIESRMSKQNRSKQVSHGKRPSQSTKSRQRSSSRLSMSSTRNAQETPTQITTKRRTSLSPTRANDSNHEGEFPSLNLKLGEYRENATEEMPYSQNQNGQEGPFTFSFSTPNRQRSDNVSDSTSKGDLNKEDEYKSKVSTYVEPESTSKEPTSSAAASLRARLKQLRNKHKPTSEDEIKSSSALSPRASQRTSPIKDKTLFNEIMKDVDELLSRPTPLADPDSNSSALGGLRKIHSSLAKTSSASDDAVLLEGLRNDIKKNASLCVKRLSAVLDFGFRCGSQTSAEALSIPLLSVAIAALMAIFMDPELSALVSKDSLCKVIHQSTYSLLDRRLAGSSDYEHILDASTCKKMVKAINKLAIQATYGAKRHISLQALHSLQIKFCESSVNEDISATDASNTNNRMSRIITKLFSRVLKAEEGNTIPFSSAGVDLKVVFSSIDEVLMKCKSVHISNSNITNGDAVTMDFVKDDRMVPCFTMARTLMIHILKVKKEQDEIDQVKALLRNHGLLDNEFTGRLFTLCSREMGFEKRSPERISPSSRTTRSMGSESQEISQLLLDVGNAESDSDRSRALHELKVFLASNRNVDLESHLSRLSAPFRKYIQNELQSPQLKPSSKASSRSLLSGFSSKTSFSNLSFDSEISKSNVSMSQKLAYLKSKINAAEATAQSVILPSNDAASSPTSTSTPQLSPTSTSNGGSPEKSSRLRERLAAASEERSRRSIKSTQSTKSTDSFEDRGSLETGAVGNAAALRARLESVRRMSTASRGSSKYT